MNPKILWLGVFSEGVKKIMRDNAPHGFDLMFVESKTDKQEHLAALAQCDYLSVNGIKLTEEYVRAAKKLKLIQLWGAGVDSYDLNLLKELNIALQNGVGFNAPAVAEAAVMLMLAVNRQLIYADASVREGRWIKSEMRDQNHSLYGKTIGILGFGSIGRLVCELVYGMKAARVLYYDPFRAQPEVERSLGAEYAEMDDVLRQSDVVSLHMPLIKEGPSGTRGIISRERLAMMKEDAILINTARGGLVDEMALYEALRDGRIRGAGLDSFSPEPPAADNPLFSLRNVVLMPHIAGAVVENIVPRVKHVYGCIAKFEKGESCDPRYVILPRR